jgi:solute carrier family 45, member 1/2/4
LRPIHSSPSAIISPGAGSTSDVRHPPVYHDQRHTQLISLPHLDRLPVRITMTAQDYFSSGKPGTAINSNEASASKPKNGSLENDRGGTNERSPLLSPNNQDEDGFTDGNTVLGEPDDDDDDDDDDDEVEEEDYHATKSVWYLIMLTISIGGLQIAWSVELSNGSPYLLSLGLSKSLMALVWIAGPLTGTLVQPYVGMLSDNCRLSWGKRKPFMLGGALATIFALMFLAWTKEIVSGILGLFGANLESEFVKVSIIVTAVVGVYVLDFAINTVQAAIRAFIVDCAPAHQQEAANAMASRIVGLGNICGYIAGYVDLPTYLWFFGSSQFKVLCAIASIALAATVLLSTAVIRERDPRLEGPPPRDQPGVMSFFAKIFTSIKRLPPQIKRVCMVQFFAWIGFFPLLFYTSSYIGEIFVEPYLQDKPNMTPEELDELYEKATRVGTFALLINSVVSLLTNLFLPFFIAPTYDSQPILLQAPDETPIGGQKDYDDEEPSILDRLQIPGFTLKRAWFASLIIFSGAMFCTVIVRSVEAATALIGLVGITWAMTLWAPWAIISAEISRRDAMIRAQKQARNLSPPRNFDSEVYSPPERSSDDSEDDSAIAKDNEEEEADQAGVILGIHNMAIAAPQIIATFASSIIFRIWQKPRGTPGDHSIAIVLALGGITVLIAAFFVYRIQDDASVPIDTVILTEEGDGIPSRPGTARSRRSSHGDLPRASMERATLVRNSSFGGRIY